MSDFIRPDAARALKRWRETLIGGGVSGLGLYWAFFTGGGLLHWVGYGLALLGALLLVAGIQRALFQTGKDGPGIVQITEARIVYMGPLNGGVVHLTDLSELALDGGAKPAHWVLAQDGLPPVCIPLTAEGADALFDLFETLPGLRTGHMLRLMQSPPPRKTVIWPEGGSAPSHLRLH